MISLTFVYCVIYVAVSPITTPPPTTILTFGQIRVDKRALAHVIRYF